MTFFLYHLLQGFAELLLRSRCCHCVGTELRAPIEDRGARIRVFHPDHHVVQNTKSLLLARVRDSSPSAICTSVYQCSANADMEGQLYLDPSHQTWMSDIVLQQVLEDIRPL